MCDKAFSGLSSHPGDHFKCALIGCSLGRDCLYTFCSNIPLLAKTSLTSDTKKLKIIFGVGSHVGDKLVDHTVLENCGNTINKGIDYKGDCG